jgi:glyoxylase-like metal-dependent hydrolase (beta-lactamase superfamily II)
MEVRELRPRLWHWRARHPEWEKDPEGWGPIVESYAYVTPGGDELVLIDPLVPDDEPDRFWRALDDDVAHHGPPQIVLTVFFHERSAPEILQRYGGMLWADARRAERLTVGSPTLYRPGDMLPGSLVAHDAVGRNESLLWLEEQRALFAGDILEGGVEVRLCPDDWLHPGLTGDEVRRALRPLLDLPIELVLTAHGEPVLEHGRDALARALAVD